MEDNAIAMARYQLKWKEGTLNSTDEAAIETIADLCAFFGGPGVLEARNYLIANDPALMNHDWEDSCVVPSSKKGNELLNSVATYEAVDYHIYPNPTKGTVQIFWSGKENAEVEVYSVLGQVVATYRIESGNNTVTLPIGQFGSGMYIVRFMQQGITVGNEKLLVDP